MKEIRDRSNIVMKRRAGKKLTALYYGNIPAAFDIETTNTRIKDKKMSGMYEGTLGIADKIWTGRTGEELDNLYKEIVETFKTDLTHRLIIYVHNLSFEYSFIKNRFNWFETFFVDDKADAERKALRLTTVDGIEFRCSALLSGTTLEETANSMTWHNSHKMVGDLDYHLIRNSKTLLSDEEWGYCYQDVQVLIDYIEEQMKIYGDIAHIPYTNTGRVREYCRRECLTKGDPKKNKRVANVDYRRMIRSLTIEQDELDILEAAFAGGFTHCNPRYACKTLHNVLSMDETSAYPSMCFAKKFPMSKGWKLNDFNPEERNALWKSYIESDDVLMCFRIHFEGLKSVFKYDHYLSKHRCLNIKGAVVDNGRVVRADELDTFITSVDYDIIKQVYTGDKMGISNCGCYTANYLPAPLIKSFGKLYKDKTELKGVEEAKEQYKLSKSMLNSGYGMMVQSIDDLEAYNNKNNRFLFYPGGVFVTAGNRHRVGSAIIALQEDYVYTDTDSIKHLNADKHKQYFIDDNNKIMAEIQAQLKYNKLPAELATPCNKYGEVKPLGFGELDGEYRRFKSLGAKRYLVEEGNDDKQRWEFELTNAGVKKNAITCLGDEPFDKYRFGFYFKPEESGKLCHTYIDFETEGTITDYQGNTADFKELSSCHLEPIGYKIDESEDFVTFIRDLLGGRYDDDLQ